MTSAWALLAAVVAAGAAGLLTGPPVDLRARLHPPAEQGQGVVDVALVADLAAAALRSGAPLPVALRALAQAVRPPGEDSPAHPLAESLATLAEAVDRGAEHRLDTGPPDPVAALADAVAFSSRTGAPVAAMLTETARVVRRRRRDASTRAAGRLASALVLPLGLAALPGFLLLGVAPVVVRLLTSLG